MTTSNPNARQVGGTHYKGMAIQPWDFIDANDIPYLEGCAIKYVARHQSKGGAEDLRKAIHFIEKRLDQMGELPATEAGGLLGELLHLIAWSSEWSQETFGTDAERGPIGPLKHLAKEVAEVMEAVEAGGGNAGEEFADLFLLLLDAARRYGLSFHGLVRNSLSKMDVNSRRVWPKPVDDEPVEHDRDVPTPPGDTPGWGFSSVARNTAVMDTAAGPAGPIVGGEVAFEQAVCAAAGGAEVPRSHPSPAQQVVGDIVMGEAERVAKWILPPPAHNVVAAFIADQERTIADLEARLANAEALVARQSANFTILDARFVAELATTARLYRHFQLDRATVPTGAMADCVIEFHKTLVVDRSNLKDEIYRLRNGVSVSPQ
jgi:NTP pyrophosphatase (non-canonical NTP hydrolase)